MCDAIGVSSRAKAGDIEPPQAEKLYKVFQDAKLAPPPTDCLAPIGVRQLLAGMLKGVRAEFYSASSRSAEVYRNMQHADAYGLSAPGASFDLAKIVARSRKYHAHDEQGEYKMGDLVEIAEGRPISKTKSWTVTRLVEKARLV